MKKVSKAFLNRKYDELYGRASTLIQKLNNPCKIQCGLHPNTPGASYCQQYAEIPSVTLCCGEQPGLPVCQYLKKSGCSVKSLRCKLWFCYSAARDSGFPTYGLELFPFRIREKNGTIKHIGWNNFPVLSTEHKELLDEMHKWRFDLLSRECKKWQIEAAYLYLNSHISREG